jgi:small subunit ribosomal protein S3Ae
MFGENIISETPTTDPEFLVGRMIQVKVPQLTGDKTRNHLKLIFKTTEVKEKRLATIFYGMGCTPEYVSRNIRAGLQKMEAIGMAQTKEGWDLQITSSIILNRKTKVNIQKQVRKATTDFMKAEAAKGLGEFVKNSVSGVYQKKMKKDLSSIYPIRFFEVTKIEVHKVGEAV